VSQSSRARVKSLLNGRLGVAKMIVSEGFAIRHGRSWPAWDCTGDRPGPSLYLETFDVHAAKEFAEGLMLGLKCKACSGQGWWSQKPGDCDACRGSGLALDPYNVGRRKVACRLLAAIEGQPTECQREDCDGGRLPGPFGETMAAELSRALTGGSPVVTVTSNDDGGVDVGCPDCKGSGHNLRGTLPPIEWSPAVVIAVADSVSAGSAPRDGREAWTRDLYCELQFRVAEIALPNEPLASGRNRSRVCPRGEHRHTSHHDGWRGLTPDQRINAKYWNSIDNPGKPLAPRWHLGRIKHAHQRRARNATRARKVDQP